MQPTDHTSTRGVDRLVYRLKRGTEHGPARGHVRKTAKSIRTSLGVALEAQHNLGRTVPSGGDIFRHVSGVFLRVDGEATGEAKVANLELAVGVDEQVAGFQVSVQNIGRVNVLEAAEDLVDEGLEVGVGEGLSGANNGGEITFHELWCVSAGAAGGSDKKDRLAVVPSYRYVSLKSFGRGISMSYRQVI